MELPLGRADAIACFGIFISQSRHSAPGPLSCAELHAPNSSPGQLVAERGEGYGTLRV